MSHWKAYREGKITLAQARHLQGLKLAGRKSKKARREYQLQEKLVRISD